MDEVGVEDIHFIDIAIRSRANKLLEDKEFE